MSKIKVTFKDNEEENVPVHRGKPMDMLEAVLIIEERDCTFDEYMKALSFLTKDGHVWKLQGFYGRAAKEAIDQGLMDEKGVVNWSKVKKYKEEM